METTDSLTTYDPSVYSSGGDPGMSWLVLLIAFVMSIIGLWRVFEKTGQPGWAAIVPIYNMYILLKVVGRPAWWIILLLIPFVNAIVLLVVSLDLAKAFGKSTLFGVVALWLLGPIGYLILGFSDAKYTQPALKS